MHHTQSLHSQASMLPINSDELDTAVEIMELIDTKIGAENPDVIVEIFYRIRKD